MDEEKKNEHKHDIQKPISNKSLYQIFLGLAIILGIVLIVNIFLTLSVNKSLQKTNEAITQSTKPAVIELTVLKNSKCTDCFDISTVISHIKNGNVNITKESIFEFNSNEGKELINKYKIEKIPAVIVSGETDKFNIQGLIKKEDVLMLADIQPPYTNAETGDILGKVVLYNLMDSTCEKCSNLSLLVNQIKRAGVKISQEKKVEIKDEEGQELIKKYNIDFAPSIILSKDAAAYDLIKQAWPQVGSVESDGSYVLRQVNPPFVNITTGELRGLVSVIYLTDKNCAECYNVSLHRDIITNPQSFSVKLEKEEYMDIEDVKGKELIAKYNISQVPTIILSRDISVYPSDQALKQFFSVEEDGSYVFRRLSVVGVYKDLATGQIIEPSQQSQDEVQ